MKQIYQNAPYETKGREILDILSRSWMISSWAGSNRRKKIELSRLNSFFQKISWSGSTGFSNKIFPGKRVESAQPNFQKKTRWSDSTRLWKKKGVQHTPIFCIGMVAMLVLLPKKLDPNCPHAQDIRDTPPTTIDLLECIINMSWNKKLEESWEGIVETVWTETTLFGSNRLVQSLDRCLTRSQRFWPKDIGPIRHLETDEVSHRGNKNLKICQIDASENSTPAMCRSDKLKSDSRDGAIVSICRIVETRQCQLVDLTNWKVPIWQIESFNFPNWKKSIWQIYTFQVSNLSNCKP